MNKYYLLVLISLVTFSLASVNSFAQEERLTAKEYFEEGDYRNAVIEYLKEFRKNPGDYELNRRIGICYLNVNDDRTKAIEYLEFAYRNDKKHISDELLLDLGNAYLYAYRFDDAINMFTKFREKTISKNYPLVDRLIEQCNTGKELVKNPLDVTFVNLGKVVNSTEADYYPFVTKDESFMVFTTRRKGTTGNLTGFQGYYTADIYTSTVKAGKWTKAKSISPTINTAEDEMCVGLSYDGSYLMIYEENAHVIGDIYMSENKGKGYLKPVALDENVNSADMETEAFVTKNGNLMYLASNRPGGAGGTDLYTLQRLPDGGWSQPVRLSNTINTPYDENFPRITEDGQTLYFASKGHKTMGGYDIFKASWNEEKNDWNEPVNIGYPINTPEDNMCFSLCGNERDAYVSCWRKEGLGDLDIYKVIFNKVEQKQTALKGKIVFEDDPNKVNFVATVTVTDKKSGAQISSKSVNPKNGKFIASLIPGTYTITVSSEGYEEHKEDIKILDLGDFKAVVEHNITLKKPAAKKPAKPAGKTPAKK